jgi:serine/threonine-protein kinase
VATASIVIASLWLIALVINNLFLRTFPGVPADMLRTWPWPGNAIAGAGVILSIAMVVVAGRLSNRPPLLLDIGLGYLIATAFLIGLEDFWSPAPHRMGVSWACIVILIYPAIAPNTPKKILIAGLIAASMDPLGLGIARLRGVTPDVVPFQVLWMFLPNYICAVIAVIPAGIIARLGRQVRKARELGSYRLGTMIGQGGMGAVYRANHRMLARPAAIKLIRPEILGHSTHEDPRVAVERFRREAEVVATLRSPHTVELYDFGVTEDETFYAVMELLEGLDLQGLVDRFGPVPSERVVAILRQACSSLGEAHRRGMIHRDIKPSNIYVTRMGLSVDFVKVLDFGLVKAKLPRDQANVMLTAPEVTTGTPAFMAPEMVQGEQPIDHRVDIYALGAVAYWLLTGQLVFNAVSAVAMLMKHATEAPVPPSQRTELPIHPELDDLILACLAKAPSDRPANAEDLARRLAEIQVPEPWTEERAARWWETHLSDLGKPVTSDDTGDRLIHA